MKCPCPICNGKGYVYNALGDFNEDCGHCQGSGAVIVEPMTNEEWFDSLTTEEKAKFICNLMKGDDLYLGVMSARDMIKDELNHGKDGSFVIYEWLKEIHE